METYEQDIIIKAFKRCYGLQQAIKQAFWGSDTNYQKECLKTLANQTGLREKFLNDNIEEIIK